MIELRVLHNNLWERPEIQYRFVFFTTDASGGLCPPDENNMWSEWRTAEWVVAEDLYSTLYKKENSNG